MLSVLELDGTVYGVDDMMSVRRLLIVVKLSSETKSIVKSLVRMTDNVLCVVLLLLRKSDNVSFVVRLIGKSDNVLLVVSLARKSDNVLFGIPLNYGDQRKVTLMVCMRHGSANT